MVDHHNGTDQFKLTRSMKIALVVSVIFHLTVLIAGTIGLPFISKPPKLPSSAIAVEIVNVADITTTDKAPTKTKPKPKEDKPEPPKTVKKVEAPPKVEAKEPPKVKPLDKPKEKKEDTVKPKPKVPPPPSEKLKKPDPPPEKKKEEPKEDKKEAVQQEEDFLSLMKNLQDSEEAVEGTEEGKADPDYSPDAPISPTMTQNELASLTNQLVGCWQIPIGAKDVSNMVVTLHIWPNPDRTVRMVEIQDKLRMSADPAFRALAESARAAVNSPQCTPLDIPMDKIDVWKNKYISIDFDPNQVT